MITTILAAIFVLGVLVFLHEFGHFIVAKLVGIRVERFSIGFPPRIAGVKIGETDYCISAIPLGGYVKLAGMIDESLDKETIKGEPWEFQSKSIPKRVSTILAGPLMNFFLAVVLFAGLIYYNGVANPKNTTVIGEVTPNFPASQAGMVKGDRILAINGQPVKTWEEMTKIIHALPDTQVVIRWEHAGEVRTDTLHTVAEKMPIGGEIKVVGLIGISPEIEIRKIGLLASIGQGFDRTIYLTKMIYVSIKGLFTGQESLRSLGGPVMIAKLAGESARSGLGSLLAFMAFLSLNLALLNVLPIPGLDGGHLLLLGIEAVTRKPLSVKTKVAIQQVGMAILFALIIFVIFNDIRNVFF